MDTYIVLKLYVLKDRLSISGLEYSSYYLELWSGIHAFVAYDFNQS